MKQLFAAFIISVCLLPNVWAEHPARTLIETSTNTVLKAVSTHSTGTADILKIHVIPHFDFKLMSKWVLGKRKWKESSQKQRNDFIKAFQSLLIRTYQTALAEAVGSSFKIKYLPVKSRPKATRVKVNAVIMQGSQKTRITFNMYKNKKGAWKAYNVEIEGISLLLNYRNEFKRVTIDTATAQLNRKNREVSKDTL